jgi:hypothetical protein
LQVASHKNETIANRFCGSRRVAAGVIASCVVYCVVEALSTDAIIDPIKTTLSI